MSAVIRFTHPEPRKGWNRIFPLFMPFAGCPERCVFCAQEAQTGRAAPQLPEDSRPGAGSGVHTDAASDIFPNANPDANSDAGPGSRPGSASLAALARRELAALPPGEWELAFYGGTFTALPKGEQRALLDLAAELRRAGRVNRVRCSTRPDALDPAWLKELKALGLDCVELGVQSFSDAALAASRRGYSGPEAARACELVKECGLELGIQLLPGLPGQSPEDFRRDIEFCLGLAPAFARLYPCLVMEGTGLAALYRAGAYRPWSLDLVLAELPPALLRLWEAGTRVIRAGLAPEKTLAGAILAGPEHPALGQRLRSRALFALIRAKLGEAFPQGGADQGWSLLAPRRFQGEFCGHRGELRQAYLDLGLNPAGPSWGREEYFELAACPRSGSMPQGGGPL